MSTDIAPFFTLHIKLWWNGLDNVFVAECTDLPEAISQGGTRREAVEGLFHAVDAFVAAKAGEVS